MKTVKVAGTVATILWLLHPWKNDIAIAQRDHVPEKDRITAVAFESIISIEQSIVKAQDALTTTDLNYIRGSLDTLGIVKKLLAKNLNSKYIEHLVSKGYIGEESAKNIPLLKDQIDNLVKELEQKKISI